MTKNYPGEKWKAIETNDTFINGPHIQISNFGRLKSFHKKSDGNIINGSMINGYRVIKLKLYKPRDAKLQNKLDYLQQQVYKLARKLKSLKENKQSKKSIADAEQLLESFKKNLSKKYKDDLKERSINYHSLFHRLVANYFLKTPKANQTIVAHLDFDKLNNKATNLKWMTPEENYAHQHMSPAVIKEKAERRNNQERNLAVSKLTITKVMLLKKMLEQGKPMKQLVKQFKITETQIYRIKRGENWANINAAK